MVNFFILLIMAVFIFKVPFKGSFPSSGARRAHLCYGDDGLRHGDLGLHAHADRRPLRYRHPHRSAGHEFAGMMTPVSSLTGMRRGHGAAVPDDATSFRSASGPSPRALASPTSPATSAARAVRPGPDALEPYPASQTGEMSATHAHALQHLLARHQGAAQLLPRLRAPRLVVWAFSVAVIAQARSNAQELHNASLAIVDEDNSQLSSTSRGRFCRRISSRRSTSPSATSISS